MQPSNERSKSVCGHTEKKSTEQRVDGAPCYSFNQLTVGTELVRKESRWSVSSVTRPPQISNQWWDDESPEYREEHDTTTRENTSSYPPSIQRNSKRQMEWHERQHGVVFGEKCSCS